MFIYQNSTGTIGHTHTNGLMVAFGCCTCFPDTCRYEKKREGCRVPSEDNYKYVPNTLNLYHSSEFTQKFECLAFTKYSPLLLIVCNI